jgi:phosphoesterase RecJ-like protein
MPKKDNKSDIWSLISKSHVIVLTTHVRPDGDGIASEIALFKILSTQNKEVYILNQDITPDMYAWLPDADKIIAIDNIQSFKPNDIDLTILLDCSSKDRIGEVLDFLEDSKKIISIDHHEDSGCYRDGCYIDTEASSIGELLYTFIPDIKQYLSEDIATCIYTSILTDTGSFAYSNTTKRVFHVISNLMNYGVKPDLVFHMIYNRKSLNHFRLLGKALERLEVDDTGKIVSVLLPLSVYKETGANAEDNEGILEVIRGLKHCELIVMLRQLDEENFKGSLRSTNNINCSYLAKLFGGGGHFRASGFVLKGDVSREGPDIVKIIHGEVKDHHWI